MKSILLYCCCIGIAVVGGCVKLFDPVGPAWDVTLNVPVINHTYTIQEIIESDPTVFKADQNGVLLYTTSALIPPTIVGNSLMLTSDSSVFQSISLGTYTIDDANTLSRSVTLGSVAPGLGPLNGSVSPVPRTPFSVQSVPMDTVREFREATVVDGTLIVEVQNNFPTAIDNLTLTFYDQWSNQYGELVVASFNTPIPSHGSATRSFPLSARKIGNAITFDASGIVTRSLDPILIDTSAGVQVGLHFTGVRVSDGEARIPEINYTTSRTYQRSDPSSINQAEIQSGQFSIRADVPFNGSGAVTLQIPNLTMPNGVPFRPRVPTARNQSHIDTTFRLDGYFISAPDQQINYTIDVHVDDSGNDYVRLNAADSVNGTISFSGIILKSLSGVVKPTSISVNQPVSIDVESMNKLTSGSVQFADASLVVELQSPPQGFEYDVSGLISGVNSKTGTTATLAIPADQRRIQPGADSIVFPGTMVAGFLNSFTPNVPDRITLNAIATINPTGTQVGTIRSSDSIAGTVRFALPFNFRIVGGVYQDTVQYGSSEGSDDTKDKSGNVQSARMSIELENFLPVALGIDTLKFLDANRNVLLTIPKQGQPEILVQSGVVTGGVVTQSTKSTSYIELNHDDAAKFKSASLIVIALRLETPATDPVRFRSSDWVKIKAWSTVNYRTNE